MGTQNSLDQFCTDLLLGLFKDLKQFYPEIKRDLCLDEEKSLSRLACEGISFLTKTLPKFGKRFDLALQGHIALSETGFSLGHNTAIPKFLRGLLAMVFDKTTGLVLPEPTVSAISDIRQLCFMFYKLELPYEPEKVEDCIASFISCDSSLPTCSDHLLREQSDILGCARALVTDVFSGLDPLNIIPKHGPGEVSTGEKPFEKMHFKRRYADLDTMYPFEEYFLLSYSQFCDEAEDNILQLEEIPFGGAFSSLTIVPKDSRGPRLIAMEPLEYMWIQQGLKSLVYDCVESHTLTKGQVNFTNQEINRELALLASKSGNLVTLDMKEASDRVSLWLVENLFKHTSLLDALLATRTPQVRLPDGTFHQYKKFAPMGSALCFPIEAICFWALAASILHVIKGVPLLLAAKQVWVFGDDIILHKEHFSSLLQHFPSFGLKFNEDKCCTHGHFRESCGMDAYDGQVVTPIRVKKLPPKTRTDANSIVAYCNQSNNLWQRGYYHSATVLSILIEKITGILPTITRRYVSFLCKWCRIGVDDPRRKRWNKDLQSFLYRSEVIKIPCDNISPDVWSEIFRCVLPHDENLRAGNYSKRYKIYLQRRWISVHHTVRTDQPPPEASPREVGVSSGIWQLSLPNLVEDI